MASRQTFQSFRLVEGNTVKFFCLVQDLHEFRYLTIPERLHLIALLERNDIGYETNHLDSAIISLTQSENHLRHDCVVQIGGMIWFGSAICSLLDYKNAKDTVVVNPLRQEAESYLRNHFQEVLVKDCISLQKRKNESRFKHLERCMQNSSFKADWNRYVHVYYQERKARYMSNLTEFLANRGGRIAMAKALSAPGILV